MNKNTTKAIKMIEEMQRIQRETIAAAEAEIKAAQEKLTGMRAELEAAKTAEEYTKICQAVRDAESALEFFTAKKNNVEKSAAFAPADIQEIKQYISKAYDELVKTSTVDIEAEALKLYALIDAHDEELKAINKANEDLMRMCPDAGLRSYIHTLGSTDIRVRELLASFYRLKMNRPIYAKVGVKV